MEATCPSEKLVDTNHLPDCTMSQPNKPHHKIRYLKALCTVYYSSKFHQRHQKCERNWKAVLCWRSFPNLFLASFRFSTAGPSSYGLRGLVHQHLLLRAGRLFKNPPPPPIKPENLVPYAQDFILNFILSQVRTVRIFTSFFNKIRIIVIKKR
jgi:hypothetical protein